jgi:hypothetical protein
MRSFIIALLFAASSALAQSTVGSFNGLMPPQGVGICAKDPNGRCVPFSADASGSTSVSLPAFQRAAFGGIIVNAETPVTFMDFPYNVNANLVTSTTVSTGTVTQANSKAVLQTSTSSTGLAQIESKDRVRYTPGQGVSARFTAVFTACAANSRQEIGIGDATDGFFFGCQGSVFGVFRRQNGSDTFTAESAWNTDRMLGGGGALNPSGQTLNITNGNVYEIQYQWLGFGMIRFFVESSTTGALQVVHTIQYANTTTNPSIFNPQLPLHAKVVNSGNTTNLTLQTASMSVVAEGPKVTTVGNRESVTNAKTGVGTSLTNLVALQNRTTFNSLTNRTMVRVDSVSIRDALKLDALVQLVRNPTLDGVPSFTNVDTTNSIAAFDVAGTTVTGGVTIMSFSVAAGTSMAVDLSPYNILIAPGDTLACAALAESSTTDLRCSLNFIEEF